MRVITATHECAIGTNSCSSTECVAATTQSVPATCQFHYCPMNLCSVILPSSKLCCDQRNTELSAALGLQCSRKYILEDVSNFPRNSWRLHRCIAGYSVTAWHLLAFKIQALLYSLSPQYPIVNHEQPFVAYVS